TDTLELLLPAFTGMVATLKFDTERMAYLAPRGFALATDIAEWLVRAGVPFRVAHELSGACVQLAESRDVELWDLSDEDFAGISAHLTPEVREVLTTLGSIDSRNAKGGTARAAVDQQIANAKAEVDRLREFAGSARSVRGYGWFNAVLILARTNASSSAAQVEARPERWARSVLDARARPGHGTAL